MSTATITKPRGRSFSREEILNAIRAWHDRYGECPRMIDWEPSRARRYGQDWRAERFEAERWPTARVVRRQFGTFNNAIQAAGLVPRVAARRLAPNLQGPDAIIHAFTEWTRRYGDVPTMADWDPARARQLRQEWRAHRYYAGDWPSARSVATHFGSFANAASAAGLQARSQGVHHDSRQQERHHNRLRAAQVAMGTLPAGPQYLARRVRDVAQARASQDPVAIHTALIDLAGAALAWAETVTAE